MVLILFAAVGVLACGFFLFVLFQWTQDTKRKGARPGDAVGSSSEKKRTEAAATASTEKHDHFSGRSREMHREKADSCGCGLGCNECERAAYEKAP